MANRRFEMYEYRQVLVRMRQGQSDRAISRARLMGRDKAQQVRVIAVASGWLDSGRALPDDRGLTEIFARAQEPSTPSTLEPYREEIEAWHREGLQGTTIYRLWSRRSAVRDRPSVPVQSPRNKRLMAGNPNSGRAAAVILGTLGTTEACPIPPEPPAKSSTEEGDLLIFGRGEH